MRIFNNYLVIFIIFLLIACNERKNTPLNDIPLVSVLNDSLNLGILTLGDTTSFNIKLKNRGKVPYKMQNIIASCGCLEIKYKPDETILPGQTRNLDVNFVAKQPGTFYKAITIKGNTTPSFTIFNFLGKIEDQELLDHSN